MTNEEFQKKVEFIIERQTRFAVNQRLAAERMTRIENAVGRLATGPKRLEGLGGKASALVASQVRLDEALRALAASQARTDERLNNFINVVERYISKDTNGNSQNRSEE